MIFASVEEVSKTDELDIYLTDTFYKFFIVQFEPAIPAMGFGVSEIAPIYVEVQHEEAVAL